MEPNLPQGFPAPAIITIKAAVSYFHTYLEGIKTADSNKNGCSGCAGQSGGVGLLWVSQVFVRKPDSRCRRLCFPLGPRRPNV